MFRGLIAAGALALALCIAGAAAAAPLSGACLWDNLAASKRAEVLANYRDSGTDSLDALQLTDMDISGWVANCGVTDANAKAASELLKRVVILHGTPDILARDYGVTAEALAKAWNGIDPVKKEAARKEVVLLSEGKDIDPTAMEAVLVQMLGALKLPREGEFLVFLYVTTLLAGDLVADF